MDRYEGQVDPDRGATRAIGLAFGLSAAASLGLTVVYALGGQPQLEGILLGIALGGLGMGFALWQGMQRWTMISWARAKLTG